MAEMKTYSLDFHQEVVDAYAKGDISQRQLAKSLIQFARFEYWQLVYLILTQELIPLNKSLTRLEPMTVQRQETQPIEPV